MSVDLNLIASIATILGGFGIIGAAFKLGLRSLHMRARIHEAILGSETQPGLVKQVEKLEERSLRVEEEVDEIKLRTAQLLRNGGSTLADSVSRHERECEQTHLQLITLVSELVR